MLSIELSLPGEGVVPPQVVDNTMALRLFFSCMFVIPNDVMTRSGVYVLYDALHSPS